MDDGKTPFDDPNNQADVGPSGSGQPGIPHVYDDPADDVEREVNEAATGGMPESKPAEGGSALP